MLLRQCANVAVCHRVNYHCLVSIMFLVKAKPILPPPKPKVAPSHPANHEIQGFMPGRLEFDLEAENDAEHLVKDMIFNDDDSQIDIGTNDISFISFYEQT